MIPSRIVGAEKEGPLRKGLVEEKQCIALSLLCYSRVIFDVLVCSVRSSSSCLWFRTRGWFARSSLRKNRGVSLQESLILSLSFLLLRPLPPLVSSATALFTRFLESSTIYDPLRERNKNKTKETKRERERSKSALY